MDRDYTDYLKDILDAVDKVQLFIAGMSYEDFIHDEKTIFAVIRAMEIIGEAAKHITDDIRFAASANTVEINGWYEGCVGSRLFRCQFENHLGYGEGQNSAA